MSSATPPADQMIGKMLGQFEIQGELGRGGMATVYRAKQKSINRIVAVKVLPPALLHDPGFYERFVREVDVIAHLEHPHILPIYDYGESEGMPYIAMRYLAGGSLAQVLRRGVPPVKALPRPISQVAQALEHAHSQGIIHRDLKPGNILLDENGNAYLSDFGIAKVLDSQLTGSAIIGTPAYMSPEQANGLALDGRSDLYALGIVLYELLTGREPFEAPTPIALLLKHINERTPSIRVLRPELPASLDAVIARATAKKPEDRYPNALELAWAFQAAIDAMPDDDADTPTLMPTGFSGGGSTPARGMTPPRIGTGVRTPTALDKPTPLMDAPPGSSATTDGDGFRTSALIKRPATWGVGATQAGAAAGVIKTNETEKLGKPRAASRIVPMIAGVIVVAALIGGVLLSGALRPGNLPPPTPTPFASATAFTGDGYALNVPATWAFVDMSSVESMMHVWRLNEQAYFRIERIDAQITDAAAFQAAIDAYDQASVQSDDTLTFVSAATQPDGSIRRSYRLAASDTDRSFLPGQTDLFYLWRGTDLVVLDTFTADQTGNRLVETMQHMIDSLRFENTTDAA